MPDKFTKIAASLLLGVHDLVDWGIERGQTTADQLRLTVAARRDKAVALVDAGLSQRQAARLLGVDPATIHRDLALRKSEGNVEKRNIAKAERRAEREAELAAKQEALPTKRYGVLYADPPWRFEVRSRETGLDRAADNHYPTMTVDEIRDLAVPAADDCALFLWSTGPMLAHALEVMSAWGFAYRARCVWVKPRVGTGYWFRDQAEELLVGTRGDIPAPAPGTQFSSAITARTGAHSAKPAVFREMIEEMFPNLPRLEMFARTQHANWDCWGLEAPRKAC